jgi:hypothetical protein
MSSTMRNLGLDRLPAADRLRLIGELWDSLAPLEGQEIPERSWTTGWRRQMPTQMRGGRGRK